MLDVGWPKYQRSDAFQPPVADQETTIILTTFSSRMEVFIFNIPYLFISISNPDFKCWEIFNQAIFFISGYKLRL